MISIINPASGEEITQLQTDHYGTIEPRLSEMYEAQKKWSQIPLSRRIETVLRFSDLLKSQEERLAMVLTQENGKPLDQARGEIRGARNRIEWLASNATEFLHDETVTHQEGLTELISYEPLGLIANISAWNYPYLVGVNVFAAAILAGNAVLYKPSEMTSLTGIEIARLWKEASLPPHLFELVIGGADTGKALLELPLDGYFFTGSYKTGQAIYTQVAPRMIPCQLELGGKDPIYISDDIRNIKAVAEATADGAFYNNGQSCCSVERIYVHESVYDTYLKAFIDQVGSWKIGNPSDEGIYFGPLTRKEQLELLKDQVDDAVRKGACLEMGGRRIDRPGYYFEPTVLTNVNHEMAIMKEESFGPVIGIMKVKDDAEAIRLMQDTDYGLTAGVYSDSKGRAQTILRQLNVGSAYWNCCDRVSPPLPWSGRKHSGIGATLSHLGLRALTRPKAYHLKG